MWIERRDEAARDRVVKNGQRSETWSDSLDASSGEAASCGRTRLPKSAGDAVLTDPSSGDERVYTSYAGGDAVNVRKRRRGQPGQARGDRVTVKLS